MKKWIAYVIVALGVVGVVYVIWDQNSSVNLSNYTVRDTTVIEANPWKPYRNIPEGDTENIYEVSWDQKYGVTKKKYCTAVFRNEQSKQYKLIAPWLDDQIIEYQNTNDIIFTKVLKRDVPEYRVSK